MQLSAPRVFSVYLSVGFFYVRQIYVEPVVNNIIERKKTMEKIFNKPENSLLDTKESIETNLNSAYNSSKEGLSRLANQAKDQVIATGKDASKMMNRQVRAQPWTYLAAASVFSWVVGYYMARRK